MGRVSSVDVPTFIANSAADVIAHVKPVAGKPLTFQTSGLGRPSDVTLIPLYKTIDQRYTVYWTIYNPTEYETHKAELAALAAKRKNIEERTIDRVDVSDAANEQAHGYASDGASEGFVENRRWRDAARGGFLSYQLKVQPGRPAALVCTYRGGEGQRRAFDVLVDGVLVASETLVYHPAELIDREYEIPAKLLEGGKGAITVRFEPHPNARTGGVVEIRTVQQ